MASYTGIELSGAGTPVEALSSTTSHTFTFTFPAELTGSQKEAYFTLEATRSAAGFYDGAAVVPGTFSNEDKVNTLVTSSYIASYVITGSDASFGYQPDTTIPVSGAFLRTTGNVSLVIS